MALNEKIQNADMMKNYFASILSKEGHADDAARLQGFEIRNAADAQAVAEIVQNMRDHGGSELKTARITLIERLQNVNLS